MGGGAGAQHRPGHEDHHELLRGEQVALALPLGPELARRLGLGCFLLLLRVSSHTRVYRYCGETRKSVLLLRLIVFFGVRT